MLKTPPFKTCDFLPVSGIMSIINMLRYVLGIKRISVLKKLMSPCKI